MENDHKLLFKNSYFFWVEFVNYIRERKESILWEVQSLIDQIKELKTEFAYMRDIEDTLNIIFHEYKDLTKEEDMLEVECFPDLRYLYAGLERYYEELSDSLNKINSNNNDLNLKEIQDCRKYILEILGKLDDALSYIKYGVKQWTSNISLERNLYYPTPTQDSLGFEKILKAVNAVVYDYLRLIFGKEWIKYFKGAKPLIVFGFGDYAIVTSIYVCHCPFTDLFRSRYWVSFGHEILHQKVYMFDEISKLDPENFELKPEKIEFVETLLNKLINPNKCKCPFLLKRFKQNLTTELQREFYQKNYMEEIICDISNTLLSGPSDFLSLLTASISFEEGKGNKHPPMMVRYYYMTKILKNKLKLKEFYNDYRIFDCLFENLQNKPEILEDFSNSETIKKLIRKIDDKLNDYYFVSDRLIYCDSEEYFNKKLYELSKNVKDDLMENKKLKIDSEFSPRVILLAGWLKRLDVYLELSDSSKNYESFVDTFTKFHNYEKRFYSNIVDYLSRYYDYIRKEVWG